MRSCSPPPGGMILRDHCLIVWSCLLSPRGMILLDHRLIVRSCLPPPRGMILRDHHLIVRSCSPPPWGMILWDHHPIVRSCSLPPRGMILQDHHLIVRSCVTTASQCDPAGSLLHSLICFVKPFPCVVPFVEKHEVTTATVIFMLQQDLKILPEFWMNQSIHFNSLGVYTC